MNKSFVKIFASACALLGLMHVNFASAAVSGDAAAGEKKASMCIGCHGIPGYRASFPENHKVPMISGQNAGYIAAALTSYQKGDRKHPTMRALAGSLSEQDIADLGAFYAQHGGTPTNATKAPAEPSAAVKGLLDKGGCAGCHGADFNKPSDPAQPKLAGQHADYLYVALKAYQTTGNANIGRGNAIMAGQVKGLSHAELKLLAGYLSSLPGDVRVVEQSRRR